MDYLIKNYFYQKLNSNNIQIFNLNFNTLIITIQLHLDY